MPFCAQKCTYCNFASGVFPRDWIDSYITGVAGELDVLGVSCEADTLYLGGGSPSMLTPEQFGALTAKLPPLEWAESTIEVAPGDVNDERVQAWVRAGINRVSLGVQSFVPEVARAAGRKHTPETVREEVARLRRHGIASVSVDLIAGLAHQTQATWQESLGWVERLKVEHVSIYMLEVDDESKLGEELQAGGGRYGAANVPGDDQIADFYIQAVERLRAIGFERYEVSNFALEGARSQHNLKYWQMAPYFGCGSDAHSFDGGQRWANVETAGEYVACVREGRSLQKPAEQLDSRRLLEDRILTGLRTADGVVLSSDEKQELSPELSSSFTSGRLVVDGTTIRLSDDGFLFANDVVAELLA